MTQQMHTQSVARPGTPYVDTVLAASGPSYFPIALAARLPFAMMVVGVLTLVVAGRDSLALGGLVSASVGIGTALCGPLVGAAADRFGQRPVLLAASLSSTLSLVALTWVVHSDLPAAAVLAVAFVIGASAPQVAPMSRARLVGLIGRRLRPARRGRAFNATMGYESAADEMVFIVGPVLVGGLAALLGPSAPVLGAAVLTLVFVTAFALHPSSLRAEDVALSEEPVAAPARALLDPALLVAVLGIGGVGLFFGSTLTALTSFMADAGHADRAGLVYGAMGIGSAVLALAVGLLPDRFTLAARWVVFASVLLAGTLLLPWVTTPQAMTLALLVTGLGIGPTMVTQYSLGARRSPAGRSATVMSMLGSAVIVGQSFSSAVTGAVAERWGTDTALLLPIAAAAVVLLSGVGNAVLSRRS